MKDDKENRLDSLFSAARTVRQDTSAAEEFFETRLMARIRERRTKSQSLFSWALRMAPAFLVVVVALGVFNTFMGGNGSTDIFSTMANDHAEYQVASYLGGE
jgi:hypothetical protein